MKASFQSIIKDLEVLIPELMEKYKVEGSSFALISNNQIVWTKGFGYANKESKILVTPETIFEAASITKPFVAYATLKLFLERKLGLDEPLPLPIYVPLNRYAAFRRKIDEIGHGDKRLATYISEYLLEREASLKLSSRRSAKRYALAAAWRSPRA